jgi:hypothetical protein
MIFHSMYRFTAINFTLLFAFVTMCLFSKQGICRDLAEKTNAEKIETMVRKSDFEVGRGLVEYLAMLGPKFEKQLSELKPGELWIDLGHGNGLALRQYLVWTDDELHQAIEKHPNLGVATKERLREFHLPPVDQRGDAFGIGFHQPDPSGEKILFERINRLPASASKRYDEETGELFMKMDRKKLTKILSRGKLLTSYLGIFDYEVDFLPMFSFLLNAIPENSVLAVASYSPTVTFADENGKVPLTPEGYNDSNWANEKKVEWLGSIKGVELLERRPGLMTRIVWRRIEGPVSWRPIEQKALIALQHSPPQRMFYLPPVDCANELVD